MKSVLLVVLMVWSMQGERQTFAQAAPSEQAVLYDPSPYHLWNRLHEALWDRHGSDGKVYGHDRIDPLLWSDTRHLLSGPSRELALELLNEFLDTNGERLIDDPTKRAVFQRDLWAIFDWLVNPRTIQSLESVAEEAQQIRDPLARAIGRLALAPKCIEELPNTYALAVAAQRAESKSDDIQFAAASLPPDLFDANSPWVCIGRNGSDILTPGHARRFSRSIFQVFLKLSENRQVTKQYLTTLSNFRQPFVLRPVSNDGRFLRFPNPDLPPFPEGTQIALVRSAIVIDSELRLRDTRVVENVQLRDAAGNREFTLSRAMLFAGRAGGLRKVGAEELDFHTTLNDSSEDIFESDRVSSPADLTRRMRLTLTSCVACHPRGATIESFNTFVLSQEWNPSIGDTDMARGEIAAIRNKQSRYDWGLLEGLLFVSRSQR